MSVLNYCRHGTKVRILNGEYVQWVHGHKTRSRYILACVLSYPPWVKLTDLMPIWRECRRLEEVHGVPYEIDHIVPLNHPKVCGLSVPWNMRPLPRSVNGQKGNTWNPDQLNLFEEKEHNALYR